jgi:hypothetical protein
MSLPLLCVAVTVPKGEYVQRGSCPAGREAVQPRWEIGACCSSPCRSPLPLLGDSPREEWWRDKDVGGGGRRGWYNLQYFLDLGAVGNKSENENENENENESENK